MPNYQKSVQTHFCTRKIVSDCTVDETISIKSPSVFCSNLFQLLAHLWSVFFQLKKNTPNHMHIVPVDEGQYMCEQVGHMLKNGNDNIIKERP